MQDFSKIEKNNGSLTLRQVAESYGISQNRTQIIPGRIYSFRTMLPVPQINESVVYEYAGKDYLNLNPTGLFLFNENWKETLLVLDFRVIPPNILGKVLEAYWRFSQMNGLNNLFDVEGNLKPLNERRLLDQRFYMLTPTVLSTILGVNNLNYAINKYNIDYVIEAKLIDWDNFGQLVNPKISIDGFYPEPFNMITLYENFVTNSI